jgi:hypothetical protein
METDTSPLDSKGTCGGAVEGYRLNRERPFFLDWIGACASLIQLLELMGCVLHFDWLI